MSSKTVFDADSKSLIKIFLSCSKVMGENLKLDIFKIKIDLFTFYTSNI